ncbi:Phospholipase/carboxylesterase family protein [Spraguea lophii 42_110]|uniref:Acyl-protein thioesterase 1 n=1 Tax=Spraguea lophii (strain 42_110) TaxID=1358809 RepID=S7WAX5_SPRLO|nr:Phospholipase/carboxylesterase family protein [Spraguea lophii 42_110]
MYFSYLELNTLATEFLLIFLHGLSGTPKEYYKMFSNIANSYSNVKMIFPIAPIYEINLAKKMKINSWFSFEKRYIFFREEINSLKKSSQSIESFIKTQGFPPEKVILAGFSQGGAVAFYMGMISNIPYKGIVCIGGVLPFLGIRKPKVKQRFLIIHGTEDEYISIYFMRFLVSVLSLYDVDINFLEHNKNHIMPNCVTEIILKYFIE